MTDFRKPVSTDALEGHILETIKSIHFGAVEIVIHDSKIVQIQKTEKLRIQPKA